MSNDNYKVFKQKVTQYFCREKDGKYFTNFGCNIVRVLLIKLFIALVIENFFYY